jgi:hypothetical protein
MPIQVTCPACASSFKLGEEHAGRRVKCPKCKGPLALPAPPEAAGIQATLAFDKFFLDSLALTQPIPLPAEHPPAPDDLSAAKAALIDARQDMQVRREEHVAALERSNVVHVRAVKAEAAVLLLKAGQKIRAEEFDLDAPTLASAEAALASARDARRRLDQALEPFAESAARRLTTTVGLLERDDVAERGAGGPIRRVEAHTIYSTAAFLATQVVGETPSLMRSMQVLGHLVLRIQAEKKPKDALLEAAYEVALRLRGEVDALRRRFGQTSATFLRDEDGEPIPLADYLVPEMPPAQEVVQLMEPADRVIDAICTTYRHVLGRLAVSAEEVERLLGLPPLTIEEG